MNEFPGAGEAVTSALVIVAGSYLEDALHAFEAAGFDARRTAQIPAPSTDRDLMVAIENNVAQALRDADAAGYRYTLVHVGLPDGDAGGSHARAHHRVEPADLRALAERLRSRARLLLTIMAFGFKHGVPADAEWVVDCRFLDNPYWVLELRELDGRDGAVSDYVLSQPPAAAFLAGVEQAIRAAVPGLQAKGSHHLMVAFGCTGGRHRSVAVAAEMARRLADLTEVELILRELPG